jgi:ABC-type lipoprotein export system ATPase subunit
MVTHDPGVASQAQRVLTMRDGELVGDCPQARMALGPMEMAQ